MEIISNVVDAETIARGRGISEYALLITRFGGENWIKRNGIATDEMDGMVGRAEVHWYECHGIGRVKMKVRQWL